MLKLVELSAPFHPEKGSGAYGFSSGTFEMKIVFEAKRDIANIGASAYGELPLLRGFDTKKQICEVPPNACRRARIAGRPPGAAKCPVKAGETVIYRIPIPIRGNYYSGLPIDVRFQLFDMPTAPTSCITNKNTEGMNPLVCIIIPAFIL